MDVDGIVEQQEVPVDEALEIEERERVANAKGELRSITLSEMMTLKRSLTSALAVAEKFKESETAEGAIIDFMRAFRNPQPRSYASHMEFDRTLGSIAYELTKALDALGLTRKDVGLTESPRTIFRWLAWTQPFTTGFPADDIDVMMTPPGSPNNTESSDSETELDSADDYVSLASSEEARTDEPWMELEFENQDNEAPQPVCISIPRLYCTSCSSMRQGSPAIPPGPIVEPDFEHQPVDQPPEDPLIISNALSSAHFNCLLPTSAVC